MLFGRERAQKLGGGGGGGGHAHINGKYQSDRGSRFI